MSGRQAGRLLGRLERVIMAVMGASHTRGSRKNAGVKGVIPTSKEIASEALRKVGAECSWSKVFGTAEGVVPAVSNPLPKKEEEV